MTAWHECGRACGLVQWARFLAEDFSILTLRHPRRLVVYRGAIHLLH